MAGSDLTAKQQQALDAYRDGGDVKDVAKTLGITTAGAHSHIAALKKKGYIDSDGKLTTKAVIGKVTEPKTAPAPKAAPEAAPAQGTVNGFPEQFVKLDASLVEGLGLRRQELATTVEAIQDGIASHHARVLELVAEQEAHERAVAALKEALDQAQMAHGALDEYQPAHAVRTA